MLGEGVREILIKGGGFNQPGCSFFGDPVNESYEGRERGGGGEKCFLLKLEIRESDRPNAPRCRFLPVFTGGEGGASGAVALLNSLRSITR